MMDSMSSQCAGKTLLEVTNDVNGAVGVRSGSVTLSFSPGNADRFPTSPVAINVTPHT
jgi:hypothetical protein